MKGFTLALLSSLLLAADISNARPSVNPFSHQALEARKVKAEAATIASASADVLAAAAAATACTDDRVLLGNRQNGGGGRGGGGGGGRGGNRGGNGGGGGGNGGGNGGNGGNGGAAAAAAQAAQASAAAAAAAGNNTANGNNGGSNGGNNNNNNNNNNNGGNNNNNNNGGNNNNNNNGGAAAAAASPVAVNENGVAGPAVPVLQSNTGGNRLANNVIVSTQANANATAGQAASATSTNNFINFCSGQTITNGLQVKEGSCNPIVMGQIPSTNNMVTTMFTSPKNGGTVKAGQTFTIGLTTKGITLGSFTNAQANYYAAPQQLDASGQIVGHAHVVVQAMKATDDTTLLDPQTFTFFKGLDKTDVNGLSTIDVQGGVPAGAYRLCTIMSSSNHASVIMPVAQRGAENTCSYFTAA
ncbi:hypothetical protein IAT38_002431 [Cryptococcus sp. DSM 104549]